MVVSASAAFAADVPVVLKAPAAPAFYNWTGIYVGGHVGYGTGMKDWSVSPFSYDVHGFLGGGQIGVNQQIGNWVIGIELDASWANLKGSQSHRTGGPPLFAITQTADGSTTLDGIATAAGRIGFAADRWLAYVKLGAAWARETHTFGFSQTVGPPFPASQVIATTGAETRFGPMLGFGAEYAFLGNWSAKLEYNYFAFGSKVVRTLGTSALNGAAIPTFVNSEIDQSIHLVKLGLNYRFDTPPAQPNIAPSPAAPGFNWSGLYVGAQGGYGIGRKVWTDFNPDREVDVSGWLAGATIGANAQAGAFVLGVEGEWVWTGIKGDSQFLLPIAGGTAIQQTELASRFDWLGIASMRAGFIAADRWLVYLKGGVALAQEQHTFDALQVAVRRGSVRLPLTGSALHTGYLAGIGVEHAFAGNWSAKLEYNYIAFRSQDVITSGIETVNLPPSVGTANFVQRVAIREHLHLVKFGINYHFSPQGDTVTARY